MEDFEAEEAALLNNTAPVSQVSQKKIRTKDIVEEKLIRISDD